MRRSYLFMALTAVLLCGVFSFARARDARVMAAPAWEYRAILLTDLVKFQEAMHEPAKVVTAVETKFNEFGRDGWELCENINGLVVFKRPKP
jgi:hypothetical protein